MRTSAAAAGGAEHDRDKPRGAEAAPARRARQPRGRSRKADDRRSEFWRCFPFATPGLIPGRVARAAEEPNDGPTIDAPLLVPAVANDQGMAHGDRLRLRQEVNLSACDGAGDSPATGSLNRTIAAAIKALFRMVANVLADKADEPSPGTARRRRGETDGSLLKPIVSRPALAGRPAARGRYAALQPARVEREAALYADDPYAAATAYLSDTLAWLWQNTNNDQWHDDDFSAKQEQYFPQP
jgi:hypothetical protein